MCRVQPIDMAAAVSGAEDEGCTVHVDAVSHACETLTYTSRRPCTTFEVHPSMCLDSPVIQKIRQDCSKEFVAFEQCLRENQGTPASCSPQVARFLTCAETVDLSDVGKS